MFDSARRLRTTISVVVVMLCGVLLLPAVGLAQGTAGLAGVVKDDTGAVLPGVTVEAASPVLIEKVRTVVTDAQGSVQDRQPAARDLHRDVHAGGFQHRAAARHRADVELHGQRGRRSESGEPRGNDHCLRADSHGRRAERHADQGGLARDSLCTPHQPGKRRLRCDHSWGCDQRHSTGCGWQQGSDQPERVDPWQQERRHESVDGRHAVSTRRAPAAASTSILRPPRKLVSSWAATRPSTSMFADIT